MASFLSGLTTAIDGLSTDALGFYKAVGTPSSIAIPGVGVYIPGQGYVTPQNPALTSQNNSMLLLLAGAAVVAFFVLRK